MCGVNLAIPLCLRTTIWYDTIRYDICAFTDVGWIMTRLHTSTPLHTITYNNTYNHSTVLTHVDNVATLWRSTWTPASCSCWKNAFMSWRSRCCHWMRTRRAAQLVTLRIRSHSPSPWLHIEIIRYILIIEMLLYYLLCFVIEYWYCLFVWSVSGI